MPNGSYLPSYIQQERLEELYLFSTEDGDVRDEDPWEPTPEPPPPTCTPQYDASCNCYLPCPEQISGPVITATTKPNKQVEAARKLKKAGVSPQALYNEAMRISGHEEELAVQSPTASILGTRYKPNGRIQVQDTELGPVPLRGVRVESRRWFNFDHSITSNTGNFTINSGYLSRVKLSLEFKNNLATTRGLTNAWQPWQAVLPINYQIGTYDKAAMQTVTYMVSAQTQPSQWESRGLNVWAAATTFNALADAHAYATTRGLPPPPTGLNIWILPTVREEGSRDGSAPMLRRIAQTSLASRFIDRLLTFIGFIKPAIIKQII